MSVSAGGVSVGSPVSSELDAELAACFSGGETFVRRVALFSARKRAAEEAERNLELGKEAAAALTDARERQAAAERDLRDAAGARAIAAKAREEAAAYAAKLRADAEEVLRQAEERQAANERRAEELAAEDAALKQAKAKVVEGQRIAERRRRNLDTQLRVFRDFLAEVEEI
jgi:hypothetical protein